MYLFGGGVLTSAGSSSPLLVHWPGSGIRLSIFSSKCKPGINGMIICNDVIRYSRCESGKSGLTWQSLFPAVLLAIYKNVLIRTEVADCS